MSNGKADVAGAVAKFAAEGIFGKSARKAQKKTASAERRLLELQAEEQKIRNEALRASLGQIDHRIPIEYAAPNALPDNLGVRVFPEGGPDTTGRQSVGLASGMPFVVLAVAGGVIVALLFTRSRGV